MFTQRGKYVMGVSFTSNSVVFNYTVLLLTEQPVIVTSV